jgi:hypothetical protein
LLWRDTSGTSAWLCSQCGRRQTTATGKMVIHQLHHWQLDHWQLDQNELDQMFTPPKDNWTQTSQIKKSDFSKCVLE